MFLSCVQIRGVGLFVAFVSKNGCSGSKISSHPASSTINTIAIGTENGVAGEGTGVANPVLLLEAALVEDVAVRSGGLLESFSSSVIQSWSTECHSIMGGL